MYVSKCKVWKLKEDEARVRFREIVHEKYEAGVNMVSSADDIWRDLKRCLLEGAEEVCGMTKGKGSSRHRVSWWWNNDFIRL